MGEKQQAKDRAKNQAAAQLSSIREMVAALDKRRAIEILVSGLDRINREEILINNGAIFPDDPTDDDLGDMIIEGVMDGTIEPEHGFEFDEEAARQTIQEDALSVEVRSGWYSDPSNLKPDVYTILLCTGGPACRIIGDLSERGEPESARIEYQDWFTPWVDYPLDREEEADVVKYAQQFWFGQ